MEYAEYIKRIEIDSLWNNGRKHIAWVLDRHINILSGVNGGGKSTILNRVMSGITTVSSQASQGIVIETVPKDAELVRFDVVSMPEVRSDFDNNLTDLLDRYAHHAHDGEAQEKLFDVIDKLFSVTEKSVVRHSPELQLMQWGEVVPMQVLSNGEKQMLTILLTVYMEDRQNCLLIMDEPEVSLHIEWQKHLINIILLMNPNVQLLLTTHSPAVIMNGWTDMVTEVEEITV